VKPRLGFLALALAALLAGCAAQPVSGVGGAMHAADGRGAAGPPRLR
jgi:hypothetical protein